MQGDIDSACYWNDKQEVSQHGIVRPPVQRLGMRNPQKYAIANNNSIINYTVKFITFLSFILGKYADTNKNIGGRD
jgi:hypothetical protein